MAHHGTIARKSEKTLALDSVIVPSFTVTITSYGPITVDYGMEFEAMIEVGQYDDHDGVNLEITVEHFPIVGKGKVKLKPLLIHFSQDMEDKDVTRELNRFALRDGAIEELAAFGAKFPGLQREFLIIARKSVLRYGIGNSCCPYLSSDGVIGRFMNLHNRECGWCIGSRFLTFSK